MVMLGLNSELASPECSIVRPFIGHGGSIKEKCELFFQECDELIIHKPAGKQDGRRSVEKRNTLEGFSIRCQYDYGIEW